MHGATKGREDADIPAEESPLTAARRTALQRQARTKGPETSLGGARDGFGFPHPPHPPPLPNATELPNTPV